MTDIDEMGPIDWVLIEFKGPLTGEAAPPLLDLVDRGLIRILDILFIRKGSDGIVTAVDISELPGDERAHIEVFVGATTGLLGEEDVSAAGEVLDDARAGVTRPRRGVRDWRRSLVLARRGFIVAATDASRAMVRRARSRLRDAGSDIDVHRCCWADLPRRFREGSFDAVLCTGNSISHAKGEEGMITALAGFS